MGNSIAFLAIATWPIIVLFLVNRFGFAKGAFLGLLGAYMFLPTRFEINIPGIPAFSKFTVTSMTLILYLIWSRKSFGFRELPGLYKVLLLGFILVPFFTAFTNSERYMFLPGLTAYDGFTDSVGQFIYIVPFLIGFQYFRNYENQLSLFKYFAVGAFIYAVLALYEIRMSPQLHNMVYGFFPHSWIQQIRSGGFRAVVFMGHGLLVAMFLAVGLGVWTALRKNNKRVFPVSISNTLFLLFVLATLVLMKSMAALIFGVFLFLMITFISSKKVHQAAVAIVIIFMTYPITSATKLFPHEQLVDIAHSIDPDRAGSLAYRFRHEAELLEHSNAKPLFGWGGWGRNRVRDAETGEDLSVTDGKWIITLGVRGWIGFLSEFLLVVLPVWAAYKIQKRHKEMSKNERTLLAAHALIVSIILLDQMPNASINPMYMLVAGALLGRVYELSKVRNRKPGKTVTAEVVSQ